MTRIYEIFFVMKKIGTCILHHSFTGSSLNEQLVSGFLSAISSFLNSIMPNSDIDSDSGNMIRAVDRGDFKILIEPGKEILGLLLAKSDTPSIRKILRETTLLFEELYDIDAHADTVIYEPYKEIIVKNFAKEFINPNDIPILSDDFIDKSTLELLLAIDNSSDVKEISNRLNEPIETIIERLAYLQELEIIQIGGVATAIKNTDIFTLTDEGNNIFQKISYVYETIMNNFGKKGVDILKMTKSGKISVNGIHLKTNMSVQEVKEIIGFSIKEGWVRPVRIYPTIVNTSHLRELEIDQELNEILFKLVNFCDGDHSLREISRKTNIPEQLLVSFLDKMGNDIKWVRN
ncbi:MAG: hypothetical protein GF329_16375 [Candidatus Lokiarchaeota archaeon]|nr:hypothetical protein [Candidatus Lokiarchaeota archaeon]